MKKLNLSLIFLSVFTSLGLSQNKIIDSLKHRLEMNISTEERILTIVHLSWQIADYDLQKALDYLNSISPEDLKNASSRYVSDYYNAKGVVFARLFKKDSAEKYFKLDLEENIKQKNTQRIFNCYYDLANLYQYFNSLDTALIYLNKTEEFYKKSKMNNIHNLAMLYYAKSLVLKDLSQQDSSVAYSIRALKLFEKNKDNHGIYLCLINNAKIFGSMKQPNKALEALNEIEKLDLQRSPEQEGLFYKLYGNVYKDLDSADKAYEMYKKAINSFLSQKNNKMALLTISDMLLAVPDKITTSWLEKYHKLYRTLTKTKEISYNYFSSLANFYKNKGNYKKAYILLDSSDKYINNELNRYYNVKNKAEVLTKLKNYKEATTLWNRALDLYDSVLSEQMRTKINELNIKYETAKKDQQIALEKQITKAQRAKIKQQNMLMALIGVASLVVLLALLVWIYIRNQRQKRKLLELRLEAEEETKREIARELHSGLGSDLTAVIMGLKEKIGDTRETQTIANIYNHIRRASHLLSLPDFIATTLEDEINSLVSNFRTIDNLNIETGIYSKNGWKDVSPLIQRRIYSIVRELFLNSMKHSEAKNISVQIVKHDKYITLTYEDDGKGYNPEQIKESKGYKDIKELVRALDADVIDDSRENEGVILTFKIPF